MGAKKSDPWMSVSDMMTTLMMMFLFIAVSYMLDVSKERNRMREVAVTYGELQNDLYNDLESEFKDDLKEWNALIDKSTLSVRFEEPDVLFSVGSSELKPAFAEILKDFFPRYIRIITKPEYRNDIEEIRIEGHSSSEWANGVSGEYAYFKNMELSQDRTKEILEYVLLLDSVSSEREWIREHLTANGLSSSKPILTENGIEDKSLSRRVEFRVRTNAEKRIAKILEE